MPRKVFKTLIAPQNAIRDLSRRVQVPDKLEAVRMSLVDALGFYSASEYRSGIPVPLFPRSLVDGFAVRNVDISEASEEKPVRLRIKGRIKVGENALNYSEIGEDEAYEVDTGAMIPPGADTVVPVEYTKEEQDHVLVYKGVSLGANIALPGSDVDDRTLILRKGEYIRSQHIASLAAVGIDTILVYKKLRVGIISTGSELVKPGEALPMGKVYDVNTYMLISLLKEHGLQPCKWSVVPDEYNLLREVIDEYIKECDIVVTSGGSSAGPEDLIYRVAEDLGEIIAHGLQLKPGKPTMLAVIRGKALFGFPGNPQSSLNVFRNVFLPYLELKYGIFPPRIIIDSEAHILLGVGGERGRPSFVPVHIFKVAGKNQLYAVPIATESYKIVSFLKSNGFIIIPSNRRIPYNPGEKIPVKITSTVNSYKYIIGVSKTLNKRIITDLNDTYILKASSHALITLFKKGFVDATIVPERAGASSTGVGEKIVIKQEELWLFAPYADCLSSLTCKIAIPLDYIDILRESIPQFLGNAEIFPTDTEEVVELLVKHKIVNGGVISGFSKKLLAKTGAHIKKLVDIQLVGYVRKQETKHIIQRLLR